MSKQIDWFNVIVDTLFIGMMLSVALLAGITMGYWSFVFVPAAMWFVFIDRITKMKYE